MLRIFYISAATRFATARELDDILAVSRERNSADQITGLLLYHDGSFAQILEGPEEAVRKCFERIRADGRHCGCRVILEERAEERYFNDWSLGCALAAAPSSMKAGDILSFSALQKTESFQRAQQNLILKSFLAGFMSNAAPPTIKPQRREELHRLLETKQRSDDRNDDFVAPHNQPRPVDKSEHAALSVTDEISETLQVEPTGIESPHAQALDAGARFWVRAIFTKFRIRIAKSQPYAS